MGHIRKINEMSVRRPGGLDPNRDDYRVYIVSKYNNDVRRYAEKGSIDDMPDHEFVEIAEGEGTVFSLSGFQENWNKYYDTLPYPEASYIRILPRSVFGKIQVGR